MNLSSRPIILIIGTRPEGIKQIPIYVALKGAGLPVKICATFQHRDLLQDVFDLFGVQPDFALDVMLPNQDLFYLTSILLQKTKKLFLEQNPQLVIVQGDTTSAMVSALSAFYLKIPVAHVEAGLRTHNLYSPFPEELNRQFISLIAKYNFAPTLLAVQNLEQSGVLANTIYQVGNPVVDAMHLILGKIKTGIVSIRIQTVELATKLGHKYQKLILLTMHRREAFGEKMVRTLQAIKIYAQAHPEIGIVYPAHPNPNVAEAINKANFSDVPNILVIAPLPYHELIYFLNLIDCVATDSGGVQEEAASLGKPVVLLRCETDRPEAVKAGLAWLAGYDPDKIYASLSAALRFSAEVAAPDLYGDGRAAMRIAQILKQEVKMVKVVIVGLGYIGLPTAILLAESGLNVYGYDIDVEKVIKISQGIAVVEERELSERLAKAVKNPNFAVGTSLVPADFFLIAVPTPITTDKTADLAYVWDAVAAVAKVLRPGSCVIVESTVPVGTTRRIAEFLARQTNLIVGKDFFVAFSPERVIPGQIFTELVHNDRLVGGVDEHSGRVAGELYLSFVKGLISQTDVDTAEMVKLVENSCRDVQIAFANQVAAMAEAAQLNPHTVINFANKHPRVKILQPGCGVGGHCIAVDPWFLIESFPENSSLLKTARAINDNKPYVVLEKIERIVQDLQLKTNKIKINVCVLGVAYKADVDDVRNSPAMFIAQELQKWPNVELIVVDPCVDRNVLSRFFACAYNDLQQVQGQVDLTVSLVAHSKFKQNLNGSFIAKDMLNFCVI